MKGTPKIADTPAIAGASAKARHQQHQTGHACKDARNWREVSYSKEAKEIGIPTAARVVGRRL